MSGLLNLGIASKRMNEMKDQRLRSKEMVKVTSATQVLAKPVRPFTACSSTSLAHILSYLRVEDKVQFLSISRTMSQEALMTQIKTYCGECRECKENIPSRCANQRERTWSSDIWTTIFKRYGHAVTELYLVGCDGIVPRVFETTEAKAMLKQIKILHMDKCRNFPIDSVRYYLMMTTR